MKIVVEETKTRRYLIPDYTKEIERGIALLDQKAPWWWKKIDLPKLDLNSPTYCVVGQTFMEAFGKGAFKDGTEKLGLYTYEQRAEYGFVVKTLEWSDVRDDPLARELYDVLDAADIDDSTGWLYSALSEQWIPYIRERQEADRG